MLDATMTSSLPTIKATKRLRKFSHKSRRGCLSCKQRHLKCDEEKPSCQKCIRANFTCEYVGAFRRVPEQTQLLLALAPKQTRSRAAVGITSSIIRPPSTLKLKTATEARYFETFCSNIAIQLSDPFNLSLWNRIMLQTSEEEESIRLGIIALGALHHSVERRRQRNDRYIVAFAPDDEHHCFAVEQYHRYIKLIRNNLFLGKYSLRTALLNCLLAICFETMHGNGDLAIAQMEVGIRLLDSYIYDKRISVMDSNVTNEEKQPSFALESPDPLEIEDDLVQAFTRLDTQANSFLHSRSLEYHITTKSHGSDCIARMPTSFPNIDEARKYRELLGRRVSHWVSSLGGETYHHKQHNTLLDDQITTLSMNWHDQFTAGIPEEILREHQQHLDEHEKWWKAFQPLLLKSQHQPCSQEYLCIVNLWSKFISIRLVLSMALSTNQLLYDDHTEKFRELLRLVKILHVHPLGQASMSLDLGYISQLYTVAFRCRDSHIRREAADILLSRSWREGLWESKLTGRICLAVINMEEEGLNGNFVPNGARIKSMRMKFDRETKELKIMCFMTGGEVTDRVIMW